MLDILLAILERLFGSSAFYVPLLTAFLSAAALYMLHKKYRYPLYILKAAAASVVSVFVFVFACMCMELVQDSKAEALVSGIEVRSVGLILVSLAAAAVSGLVAATVCALSVYTGFQRKLRQMIRYTKAENYGYNPIEAWRALESLPPSKLTGRQRAQYEKYRIYLRMILGNFSGVKEELEAQKEKDRAYYHFLKFVQCTAMGHMEDAAREIRQAEEDSNADTEPLIRGQIILDRGVGYVGIGMYEAADDAFSRAIAYCKKHRVKEKTVWQTLYYNYVFNRTRLHPQMERTQWEQLLEPLKQHLDMENPQDYMAFSNIELELLRQTKAGREEIDDNVYRAFVYLMQSDIPVHNRCMLEASTARMIWSARLNPTNILRALENDREHLLELPMPARYHCMKQIDLFFGDLHGSIVEEYDRLKQSAFWYMMNQAERDLEDYRRSLPAEAVYERCFCLKELAGWQQKNPQTYRWDTVIEWLENAIALYHENGLELEEIQCELAIMDEAVSPLNMDQELRLAKLDYMNRMLERIESAVPKFEKHPVMAELAVRLSFYSCAMHDYGRCRSYYEVYWKLSEVVSLDHFAPWLHRYYMAVCFAVRALYFLDTVNAIRGELDEDAELTMAEQLFLHFYDRNGGYESFALAMVLGLEQGILLKKRMWPIEEGETFCKAGEGIAEHLWLFLPQIGMEIDVTYSQFTGDVERDWIIFNQGYHPLERNRSKYLRKRRLDSFPLFAATYVQEVHIEQFKPEQQAALREAVGMIVSRLPEECPSVPVLSELYRTTMLPVGTDV